MKINLIKILPLFILVLYSCSANKDYVIKYNETELTTDQKKVINKIKTKKGIILFFDNGFKNDSISVFTSKKKIYNEIISTNYSLGVASSTVIPELENSVIIKINKSKDIKLKLKKDYPFININKSDNKFFIEYRKSYKSYK